MNSQLYELYELEKEFSIINNLPGSSQPPFP
jgi:hypothetical protein